MNGLEVVSKRVKYIHSADNVHGYEKKCDLDVEMTIDLVKESDNFDTAVIFSGDGDLAYAMRYLHENKGKSFILFGAGIILVEKCSTPRKMVLLKPCFLLKILSTD